MFSGLFLLMQAKIWINPNLSNGFKGKFVSPFERAGKIKDF